MKKRAIFVMMFIAFAVSAEAEEGIYVVSKEAAKNIPVYNPTKIRWSGN